MRAAHPSAGHGPRTARERTAVRRAWLVLACALLAAVCAGVLGPAAFSALGTGGALATGTEAERAARQAERLGVPAPDLVLALSEHPGTGRAGAARDAAAVVRTLSGQGDVKAAWSAQTTGNPWLRSKDGRTLLVLVRLEGTDKERKQAAPRVVAAARAAAPHTGVEPSGGTWANREIDESVEHDLRRAELVAAPVLFAVLVLAYGSVVSALLPVVVAALTIGCAVPVLGLLAQVADISRVAVSAASAIGFGLAVDYSLFLLARVREESARGADLPTALAAARRSSGRSVAFSAAAVTVCLAAALAVPVPMLRALALAGMTVAVLAALVALTVLPACLCVLGPRAQAFDPLARLRRTRVGDGSRFWRRTATAVTARPLLAGGLALLLLALLAVPFTHARLGIVDERTLPASAPAAAAAQRVRAEFTAPPERILTVVVNGPRAAGGAPAYGKRLARLPGIIAVRVAPTAPAAGGAVLLAAISAAPDTRAARTAVRQVRQTSAPGSVTVGGRAADVTDTAHSVLRALPACLLLPAAGLMLLLSAFTRTFVAPLKALAVAAVSLGAILGALVVLFQEGRGGALFGSFTATGTLDASILLFVLFIALALSVDYEVFLLGRIREEFDRRGDNRTSIVEGIARTGRLLTSAAAAVAISTAAMATSQVALLKFIGIGVALGALVDALLVRGVLVPAVMAALGPLNWWSPARTGSRPGTVTAEADKKGGAEPDASRST
ncbi:MMPL family transporter [Streptomyces sp. p1417]|uniref:MMPL family transporter n=1 Tax=Streptomyces typhae TaxID=2681492 RepID=A0A6L6X445_9ACTN|nr:MMPL family transporter [Streptomyces typhae]MVO88541.1 MMPL family transporter [Streptomyces typhae]